VSSLATLGAGDRLRLFFGLPLPPETASGLAAWASRALGGLPGVRLLAEDQLHVTLAFLGSRPAGELPALERALDAAAEGLAAPLLEVERYRETEHVAMVVLRDDGGRAALVQARLSERLAALGLYEPERRPWLAHATVARVRGRPHARPSLPQLPPFSPSEAALYNSLLRPGGAQYRIVHTVALGGSTT
jgi:2'-5' RNA ligase